MNVENVVLYALSVIEFIQINWNKGIIGFRFDALNNLFLKKCSFHGLFNSGVLGNDKKAGNYLKSHDQAKRNGYFGSDATGINISYCSDVNISHCSDVNISHGKFEELFAKHGNATGINIIFKSDVSIHGCSIKNIKAGTLNNRKWIGEDYDGNNVTYSDTLPNKIPISIGIRIEKDCVVDLDKIHISDLRSPREPIKVLRE